MRYQSGRVTFTWSEHIHLFIAATVLALGTTALGYAAFLGVQTALVWNWGLCWEATVIAMYAGFSMSFLVMMSLYSFTGLLARAARGEDDGDAR